ncbi:NHL repeat-containing protein [Mucilaginibacter psychrotolerans]|uniref:NHL repeat-containing protein n=1 Tax=Mucilaginibacter psychrotolerans TaxID=1524096 RepID=A0A4Y8SMC9_9SPHI|nr:hypothetical protein [Mucilaginibacter psychrotolerans]TFF39815.1 hypothetical protein E2R66_05485 [Mucilaginibacter psychrotolerans]
MKTNTKAALNIAVPVMVCISFAGCKKDMLIPKKKTHDLELQVTAPPVAGDAYTVSTLVSGLGTDGLLKIQSPYRICSATNGNLFITAPNSFGAIYKINPDGILTKLANIHNSYGIKAGENETVYVTRIVQTQMPPSEIGSVVKLDKNNVATTIPLSIPLASPLDLAIAPDSTIYIADEYKRCIIKLTKQGVASVFAGKSGEMGLVDGQGVQARFSYPFAIRYANDGTLWVLDGNGTDKGSQTIRKITLDGSVTTFFKLKPEENSYINSMAVTKRDKDFNISPYENAFMFITSNNGRQQNQLFHLGYDKVLTAITGLRPDGFRDGNAGQAAFFSPTGLTVNPNGIFVADLGNNAIRKIARK